jgi:hypothetical protein
MKMIGTNFWRGTIFKRWQQLLAVTATVTALGACGPGLDSLGPFTIGGTITGLTGTLVLQNNGGDNLSLIANGNFTFKQLLSSDSPYAVTVLTQPSGQICTVSSGGGTAIANVTTVSIQCIVPWVGIKQLGGAGAQSYGQSVATDASGNVYVAGDTYGWLDGNSLIGTSDFFLTKYSISGVRQFTQQLGVARAETHGQSVATDVSGNVYVAGYTTGGLDSNPLSGQGSTDLFFTKYSSSGVKQYSRQLGVAGSITYGFSITTDISGNVYVAGSTTGGLDGNTLSGLGSTDYFLTKYNSNGDRQYTKQLGVANAVTVGTSVAADASGNVYVAGYTSGGLAGNILMGTTGFNDFFVTKYNSNGDRQYTKQSGVAGANTYGRSVAVDVSGNAYVAGDTNGALNGTLTGDSDFFVTQYDSSGVEKFTWQLGVANATTSGHSISVDAKGNVYVAGETTDGLYGNQKIGTIDSFVVKYNGSGVPHFVRQLGVSGGTTIGRSVAIDTSGDVFVAGETEGQLDSNTLAGNTSYFFVTKYDNNGVKQ